jgi:hypothetical protein
MRNDDRLDKLLLVLSAAVVLAGAGVFSGGSCGGGGNMRQTLAPK